LARDDDKEVYSQAGYLAAHVCLDSAGYANEENDCGRANSYAEPAKDGPLDVFAQAMKGRF
jgi:hypothetical protein